MELNRIITPISSRLESQQMFESTLLQQKLHLLLLLPFSLIAAHLEPIYNLLICAIILSAFDFLAAIYVVKFVRSEEIDKTKKYKKLKTVLLFCFAIVAIIVAEIPLRELGVPEYLVARLFSAAYAIAQLLSILKHTGHAGLDVAKNVVNLINTKISSDAKMILKPDENKEEEK